MLEIVLILMSGLIFGACAQQSLSVTSLRLTSYQTPEPKPITLRFTSPWAKRKLTAEGANYFISKGQKKARGLIED